LPKQEGLARRPQGTKGRWREAEKQSQPFRAIRQRSAFPQGDAFKERIGC